MTTPLKHMPNGSACEVQVVPSKDANGQPHRGLAFHHARDRSADRLFAVLEQSDVMIQGHRTPLEVYAVTDLPEGRWVQLALGDSLHRHLITLHLPARGDLTELACAIEAWCADQAHTDELIDML